MPIEYINKALVLPYNERGEILLQDRRGHRPPPWGFFGGSIEAGETPLEAVTREIWEELEIKLDPLELDPFTVITDTSDPEKTITMNLFTWKFSKNLSDLKLHEGSGMKFVSPTEAEELPLSQRDLRVIAMFTEKFKQS